MDHRQISELSLIIEGYLFNQLSVKRGILPEPNPRSKGIETIISTYLERVGILRESNTERKERIDSPK